MVAAKIHGPLRAAGLEHRLLRIAASSQGGLAMVAIHILSSGSLGPRACRQSPATRSFVGLWTRSGVFGQSDLVHKVAAERGPSNPGESHKIHHLVADEHSSIGFRSKQNAEAQRGFLLLPNEGGKERFVARERLCVITISGMQFASQVLPPRPPSDRWNCVPRLRILGERIDGSHPVLPVNRGELKPRIPIRAYTQTRVEAPGP